MMKLDVIALEKSKQFVLDNARHTAILTVTKDEENGLIRATARTVTEENGNYETFPPVSWTKPLKLGEDFETLANEILGEFDSMVAEGAELAFGEDNG